MNTILTRLFLAACCLLVACSPGLSQTTTFQKTYGGSGEEDGYHILAVENGYLIAGYTTSSGHGGKDAYLLRLDSAGNMLWQRTYGGTQDDQFTQVTKGNDGGFLAMGDTRSRGQGDNDVFLTKVDDNGNVVWSETLGGGGEDLATVPGEIQHVPNGYLISGQQYSFGNGDAGAYFVRLNNIGGIVWERSFVNSTYNILSSTHISGDTAYVSGTIEGEGCFGKLDLSTGLLWSIQTYPQPFLQALYNLRPTQDSNLLLSDAIQNETEQRQWVMKIRRDGSVIWSKAYGLSGIRMRGLAELAVDSGFILSPRSQPGTSMTPGDGILAKINGDGVLQWSYRYGGAAEDYFWKVIPTGDGGYVAVGATESNGQGGHDIFVVKTDAAGLIASCCSQEADIITMEVPTGTEPATLDAGMFSLPTSWNHTPIVTSLSTADYCPLLPPVRDSLILLCSADTFFIAGLAYTAPDTIIDYSTTTVNCDTVIRYLLLTAPLIPDSQTIQFCPGDSVVLGGISYTQPGVVIDTVGCTRLTTNLVYQALPQTERSVVLCAGQTITIDGVVYGQPAMVTDTLDNPAGCDTIVHYLIQLVPLVRDTQALSFCQGDSIVFGGVTYTQPAVVVDTVGCDTVLTTFLTYQNLFLADRTVVLCAGQTITINGVVYDQPAMVSDTLNNPAGCDTLVRYLIQLAPLVQASQTISFCPGDSIVFGGITYTQPVFVVDTIGCDTVLTTSLVYQTLLQTNRTVVLCAGQTITIDGVVYSQPAMVIDTLDNPAGCDTIVQYVIQLAPLVQDSQTIGFCPGDSIVFGGVTYTQPAIVVDTIGCDTVLTTSLVYQTLLQINRTVVLCAGQTITIDGVVYDQPATVIDTLNNPAGCDTIVRYVIQLAPLVQTSQTLRFCPGESITFGGVTYTQPAVVVDTIGCDTVLTTSLEYQTLTQVDRTVVLCAGQTITINGVVYSQAATVIDTLDNPAGCDTIVRYVIQLVPLVQTSQTLRFCPGESVTFGGVTYTQPAVVVDTIGCDTVVTTRLEYQALPQADRTVVLCAGQTITINGVVYSQPATVIDTLDNPAGCDTIVRYVIQLAPLVQTSQTLRFCPGESITFGGVTYTQPAVVVDTIGCDTVLTTRLEYQPLLQIARTITRCAGQSITINGVVYTQPAIVTDTLDNPAGCDTIVNYDLQFRPLNVLTKAVQFCRGDSVIIDGTAYTQPGTVTSTIPSTTGDCDTLLTYTLVYESNNQPSVLSLVCPANISITVPAGAGPVPVSYASPSASSDCICPNITSTLTSGGASGSNFPVGLNTVCYRAEDACGQSKTCCFTVNVEAETACDTKVIECLKFELLRVNRDVAQNRYFYVRITNNCAAAVTYAYLQLPNGLVATTPANNSIYTAPSGRTYTVRNPNASPFYSIRFQPGAATLVSGQSDVFRYALPAQANVDYIHAAVRLASGTWYEAYLNTFSCPFGTEASPRPELESRSITGTSATWRIYPNPVAAEGTLAIEGDPLTAATFVLQDLTGRVVLETQVVDNHVFLGKYQLDSGVYFFKILENAQVISSGKIGVVR